MLIFKMCCHKSIHIVCIQTMPVRIESKENKNPRYPDWILLIWVLEFTVGTIFLIIDRSALYDECTHEWIIGLIIAVGMGFGAILWAIALAYFNKENIYETKITSIIVVIVYLAVAFFYSFIQYATFEFACLASGLHTLVWVYVLVNFLLFALCISAAFLVCIRSRCCG
jgi:hypothetical protein